MLVALNASLVLGSLLLIMIVTKLMAKRYDWHPEIARKSVHIGMGVVTSFLPLLFDSSLPVIILACIACLSLLLLKKNATLNKELGGVLHGVNRSSLGEMYFPISVAAVFTLSHGNFLAYLPPILILTLADSIAALIGIYLAKITYNTTDGKKTIEGSIAFYLTSCCCIFFPYLFWSDLSPEKIVSISLLTSAVIMLVEALSWKGMDNLLVPIGSFLLIEQYIHFEISDFIPHIIVLTSLVVYLLWWRTKSSLRNESILAAIVYGYVAWALAGWPWLLVALATLISYPLLTPENSRLQKRIHGLRAIVSVTLTGFFWILIFQISRNTDIFYLYSLSFAGHLALISLKRQISLTNSLGIFQLILKNAAKAWLLIMSIFVITSGMTLDSVSLAILALPALMITGWLFYILAKNHDSDSIARWIKQTMVIAILSGSGLIPIVFLI